MRTSHGFFGNPREVRTLLVIHAAIFTLLAVCGYAYYLLTLHGLVDRDGNPFGRDFTYFWRPTQLLKEGDVSGIYSPDVYAQEMRNLFGIFIQSTWPYPPYFLLLLLPFTFFTRYAAGYAAWVCLNASAFCLAMFRRSGYSPAWRWIAFSAPVVLLNLYIGQSTLLITALLIGGFRLLAPAPVLAGILFGLSAFKPQLALLVPVLLFAVRKDKAFLSGGLTFITLVLVSGFLFGWALWHSFYLNMTALTQNLPGLMISPYGALLEWGVPPATALHLQAAISLLVAGALYFKLTKMREAHWTAWAKLFAPAVYLATPYGFIYDLCFLSAAWVAWLYHQRDETLCAADTILWLALWYAPLLHTLGFVHRFSLIPLLILAAFLRELRA